MLLDTTGATRDNLYVLTIHNNILEPSEVVGVNRWLSFDWSETSKAIYSRFDVDLLGY